MKILIKLATRGRVDKFYAALQNVIDTISGKNEYLIVVSIDSDDYAMIAEVENVRAHWPMVKMFIGPPNGKIAAINRDINYLDYDWDLLINFSDDQRFTFNKWDVHMIHQHKIVWGESTDFFAHWNDGYVGEALPTMSVIGREYYERFFYVYAPCYKSVSCDAESFYVSQMLGRWHYFPDIIFKHEHYTNIKGMTDNTYRVNDQYADQDTKTYFKRLNKNFYVNNPGPTPFDKYKTK
jgi:hypothetical protein